MERFLEGYLRVEAPEKVLPLDGNAACAMLGNYYKCLYLCGAPTLLCGRASGAAIQQQA